MEKLKHTAGIISVTLTVLFWLLIVYFAFTTVVSYLTLAGETAAEAVPPMNVGGVTLNAADLDAGGLKRVWAVNTVLYGLVTAAACFGVRLLRGIVRPMREGRPFDAAVSGRMRKLGWYSLICGAAYILYEIAGKTAVLRLVSPSGGTVSVEHNINLWVFLIAGLIFLFSYIFRYGEELQRLSDETL